ncbi:NAD(P)/FAD-dependent oxidoreductase [uncultured Ferrimonas sp.]|uniref:flavin-containing monooxygenase n=1 Tax=uncultured Ferrimonas sp. TaxID=432640 RepID=UPI00260660C4|nr:NAD(P)/FAD-dependent oxidoreductase [uncultured Ferrimonas sp.]
MATHYDHIIIGAGLSGLGLASQLKQQRPNDSWLMLEARANIGGTWDLFRYPGIRSDSDMYSYSFSFKPWQRSEFLSSGERIRAYLAELCQEQQLQPQIQFNHKVLSADWNSQQQRWTLTVAHQGQHRQLHCKVLFSCAGYYNYAQGHRPKFNGIEQFQGVVADPQHWPKDLDHQHKQVVVIGSGATAASIVPEMAKTAARVTMLQRSPSYFFSLAATDWSHKLLKPLLPARWLAKLTRHKYISLAQTLYFVSKQLPRLSKALLRLQNLSALRSREYHQRHFQPNYNPWQQRLCVLPDNDLFHCIRQGKAQVLTDEIDHISANEVVLRSGQRLHADIIVPATGLKLQLWGGMTVTVDGVAINSGDMVGYKGLMYGNVPNFINIFGYISASWTLRAELSYQYVFRLLEQLDNHDSQRFYPHWQPQSQPLELMLNLSAGYVQRSADILPKRGQQFPWCSSDLYRVDAQQLRNSPIQDGVLQFEQHRDLAAALTAQQQSGSQPFKPTATEAQETRTAATAATATHAPARAPAEPIGR